MTQGELDAVHGFAGIPISGLTKLAQSVPCHLLTLAAAFLSSSLTTQRFAATGIIS